MTLLLICEKLSPIVMVNEEQKAELKIWNIAGCGGVGVCGAQLCNNRKARAAFFVVVWVETFKDRRNYTAAGSGFTLW